MAAPMTHEEWVARWNERYSDRPSSMPLSPTVNTGVLLREEVSILRLLKAIAEQERDDAKADAAAYRHERDTANDANRALRLDKGTLETVRTELRESLRALRLAAAENATLLRAARHVGREQEKELDEQRAHITALVHDEWNAVGEATELRERIDTYQCEIEGLKAELAQYREGLAYACRSTFDPRLMP